LEHPNPDRHGGRRIFVVRRDDYVYLVPFVEDEHTVFLKTIIPSRKATKQYLAGLTKHGDGIAAGGILRRTVHGNYINPLADAVKLDADVIVGAGNS
jgi:hypothetical protein